MLSPRIQTFLSKSKSRLASWRGPWLWFALFALAVSFAYSNPTPARLPPARPEAHGDGLYYYAYLRSLAFDHDVDFGNDYRLLGDQFYAGINPISKLPQNVFTVGPALFWMPLVPVAKAAQHVSEWFGLPHEKPDGSESGFQRIVLYGSTLAGLLATALALVLALRITEPSFATLSALGLCLGSPLIWFMLRQPSFSHATDACAVALFASFWLWRYGSRAWLDWVVTGALLGFAMMVRPQNVANALLPLAEWLIVALALARARDYAGLRRWFGLGLAFSFALLLAFSPLLLIWRKLYGQWTLVPQGESFMHWSDSRWEVTLFSSRSGLFAWHPLVYLSVVGLGVLACSKRYAKELRLFAAIGILVLFTQSYINGAAKDWWGGWAFGGRRFLSCFIYWSAGLAVILETFRRAVVQSPQRFAKLCAAGALLMAALYNRSLADDYLHSRALPDQPQSMKSRYQAALDSTLDQFYSWTGNPGSWPANLWFALRAHTSPERYDAAAPADLWEAPHGALAFMDDQHAMSGFDEKQIDYHGKIARLSHDKHAIWVFSLRRQIILHGLISVAASDPGTRVRMRIGGREVFDKVIATEWTDYNFELPYEETHTGLFYVEVEHTLPKPGAFVAWEKAFFMFELPPEMQAEEALRRIRRLHP